MQSWTDIISDLQNHKVLSTNYSPAYLPPRLRRIRQMRRRSRRRNAIMHSSIMNQPALAILCSTGSITKHEHHNVFNTDFKVSTSSKDVKIWRVLMFEVIILS